MRGLMILLAAFAVGLVACSEEKVCAPGATQQCLCGDGGHGVQSCAGEGDRWEACACSKGSGTQGSAQVLSPDPPGVAPAATTQPAAAQPGAPAPAKPVTSPAASAQATSGGNETPGAQVPAGSPLGARCMVDRDCSSGECKGFKCIQKVGTKAPLGASCVVDGDCESLECKGFKCVQRK
jgi:hypothetical protein